MNTYIPEGYKSLLGVYDTQKAIGLLKRLFEDQLAANLNLFRVSAPLFLEESSGLNDNLNGVERPVRQGELLAGGSSGSYRRGRDRDGGPSTEGADAGTSAPHHAILLEIADPQTSGGLLLAASPRKAKKLEAAFARDGVGLSKVGRVREGSGIVVR